MNPVQPLTRSTLRQLMECADDPCVSIYLPTHRAGNDTQQDPIRLKNLVTEAQKVLEARPMRSSIARRMLAPVADLLSNDHFWRHQGDGLAIFRSAALMLVHRLPEPVEELLVVSDGFHVKPLIPHFSVNGRFHVLALDQYDVHLYQGGRHTLFEIQLPGGPTIDDVAHWERRQRQLQWHTRTPGPGTRGAIFHGQGADEGKELVRRFCQEVDHDVHEVLHGDPAPLVPAGVDTVLSIFRQASTQPGLTDQEIRGSAAYLDPDELYRRAWPIVEPIFRKAQDDAFARYHDRKGTGRTSTQIEEIVIAGFDGRIDTLVVPVGAEIWGAADRDQRFVEVHSEHGALDKDLLNEAAVETLLKGGTVHAVKPDEVPDGAAAAAIFRY